MGSMTSGARNEPARPHVRCCTAGLTLEWTTPERWRLSGDLDCLSSGLLEGAAASSGSPPVIYLDCRGVEFIDVAGWRALGRLRRDDDPVTDVRICHPSAPVRQLIRLLGHP